MVMCVVVVASSECEPGLFYIECLLLSMTPTCSMIPAIPLRVSTARHHEEFPPPLLYEPRPSDAHEQRPPG